MVDMHACAVCKYGWVGFCVLLFLASCSLSALLLLHCYVCLFLQCFVFHLVSHVSVHVCCFVRLLVFIAEFAFVFILVCLCLHQCFVWASFSLGDHLVLSVFACRLLGDLEGLFKIMAGIGLPFMSLCACCVLCLASFVGCLICACVILLCFVRLCLYLI
jgi:hypothetical protein